MKSKRKMGKHSEKGFIINIYRYQNIDEIFKSNDFNELKNKVSNRLMQRFYDEFVFINIIWKIEYELLEFLDYLYQDGKITNIQTILNQYTSTRSKYYSSGSDYEKVKKANKDIRRHVKTAYRRLFSPLIAFHYCGVGLGELVNMLIQDTTYFALKDRIIPELIKLKKIRDIFLHDYLTSRANNYKKLKFGINTGKDLLKSIKDELDKKYYSTL
ncbi:MAG: hypothetical protein V1668_00870 [Patescibacteria group bacterium]